jgi:hypothetical protein
VETFEERREFVEELREQWRTLWREHIEDKVRAEGISDKDYSQLFVERGTVIMATRRFKAPDFYEILQQHLSSNPIEISSLLPSNPSVGGWKKFMRASFSKQQRSPRRKRFNPTEPVKKTDQQLKKCGRGWLHFKR